jgi:hypothetical protein
MIEPVLTAEQRQRPSWTCWKKLVELYVACIQHEFTLADIKRVDDLVIQHSQLFDSVSAYCGFKRPKHHFMTHLAGDIYNYGPMREYWTFGFEGFNKVIKSAARRSNWRRESYDICKLWSLRAARWLHSARMSHVSQSARVSVRV